jgi:hypothetical protein
MARPTIARAEPALLETAAPVPGGGGVDDEPDGPTGVWDPVGIIVVPLLGGGGMPVPVLSPLVVVLGQTVTVVVTGTDEEAL